MSLAILGLTLDFVGKALIGLTVLMVHRRLMKEHKIDVRVIRELKKEQLIGTAGIALIVVGYLLELSAQVL